MFKDVEIVKAKVSNAKKLRNLRLKLVKENPKTYGVLFATEKKKGIDHFTKLIKEYDSEDSGIFLLKKGNQFIGMGAVRRDDQKDPTVGYLGSLGVLKEYQGQGLGKYLLKYRLEWIKKNTKFKKVKTIVQKSNLKMLSLAEKFGFKIVGEGAYYNIPEYHLEKKINR